MRRWLLALLALLPILVALPVAAHEARPAYLQIDEVAPERYALQWRTPVLSGMALPVVVELPPGSRDLAPPQRIDLPTASLVRYSISVPGGLVGKRVGFPGLQGTITDVLVRVTLLDGSHSTGLVRPSQPWVEVTGRKGTWAIASAFVQHGIEHILGGYDHLLFVLALVLIVPNRRVLFWTITAFTVAHSMTLALATLGVVHVPGPPVEAAIALSILLLASEIIRIRQGHTSLTQTWPWLVAFSFGLLHGFGFAGALAEIGLPQTDLPLALFAFNVGVELGQLAFIAVILTLAWLLKRLPLPPRLMQAAPTATAAFIGTIAAFWFVERVVAFAP